MQHAVFINYRREDVPDAVGRVYDKLTVAFGEATVFKDVDALPVGKDFGELITSVIVQCRVVLAFIGPGWVEALAKRQADPTDWVRIELETALKTPNVEVIPVLLSGFNLPSAEQLPESLHPLVRLNAAIVRRDPDFHRDMSRLVTALSASGVARSDDGSGAVGLWRELNQTEDIEDLRRFIQTFGGTAQAFEARRRVDQLLAVKRLKQIEAYLEHVEPEDDEGHWLLIAGVDAFKRCWANTPWDNELARLRQFATVNADYYYEDGSDGGDALTAETVEDWGNRANEFIAKFKRWGA